MEAVLTFKKHLSVDAIAKGRDYWELEFRKMQSSHVRVRLLVLALRVFHPHPDAGKMAERAVDNVYTGFRQWIDETFAE